MAEVISRDLFQWGLRNDQPPTLAEERRCALGNHRWRPKGANDHPVERSPQERVPSGDFGPPLQNPYTALKATGDHRSVEEISAALVGIEQHECRFWPLIGQDKTRKPSAGPEIQDVGFLPAPRLTPREVYKPLCMPQMPLDGSGAQEPELPRGDQYRPDGFRYSVVVGNRHRRLWISRQAR